MKKRKEPRSMTDFFQHMRRIETENMMLSEEDRHRLYMKEEKTNLHQYLFF